MKLKIDLHTHPLEALQESLRIKGVRDIDRRVAEAIVKAVKSAGINGIAITEHNNFNRSWAACLEITNNFPYEGLVFLPGEEIDYQGQQLLRIYVPDRIRRRSPFFRDKEWFVILAHPGYYHPLDPQFDHLELDAVEKRSIHGEFAAADTVAAQRDLPLVSASDARQLEKIGLYSTEIEFR